MSLDEEQTRDEIEEVVNDEPPVQEPVQETVIETILEEEEAKPVKATTAKAKAKPKTKITKEPVEPIKEVIKELEPIIEVEEKPKIKQQLKIISQLPRLQSKDDPAHTKLYSLKKRILQRSISRRS